MEEQLITLETAKLLKVAGFKEDVKIFYESVGTEGGFELFESYKAQNYNTNVYSFSATTLFIAQKWLRETKNMHIAIIRNACGYGYDISKADNGTHIADGIFDGPNDGGQWDTYEEALETGIQEALKLLKEE
ncbi:hypothetical protein [Bacteroides thetaiotaomicron]|uniref:hypothetical protein n=1 Tax=Bacteroides thetaiotaomicron TaxID=818 RepID=UPI0034A375CD